MPKLVRDKIIDLKLADGETVTHHIADDNEYWESLKQKLTEEIEEYFTSDKSAEEMADILEILDAIADFKEINKEEIKDIKVKKAEAKGKFEKRLILDSASK